MQRGNPITLETTTDDVLVCPACGAEIERYRFDSGTIIRRCPKCAWGRIEGSDGQVRQETYTSR